MCPILSPISLLKSLGRPHQSPPRQNNWKHLKDGFWWFFPFEAGHSHAIFREQLNGWKPKNGHKKHGLLQPAAHRWRPESAAALHPLLPAQVPDSSGSVSHILVDAQLLLKQFQDISSMGSMNGHITLKNTVPQFITRQAMRPNNCLGAGLEDMNVRETLHCLMTGTTYLHG